MIFSRHGIFRGISAHGSGRIILSWPGISLAICSDKIHILNMNLFSILARHTERVTLSREPFHIHGRKKLRLLFQFTSIYIL
jgi:hypothetical protein